MALFYNFLPFMQRKTGFVSSETFSRRLRGRGGFVSSETFSALAGPGRFCFI
jgi:hypothetical protein